MGASHPYPVQMLVRRAVVMRTERQLQSADTDSGVAGYIGHSDVVVGVVGDVAQRPAQYRRLAVTVVLAPSDLTTSVPVGGTARPVGRPRAAGPVRGIAVLHSPAAVVCGGCAVVAQGVELVANGLPPRVVGVQRVHQRIDVQAGRIGDHAFPFFTVDLGTLLVCGPELGTDEVASRVIRRETIQAGEKAELTVGRCSVALCSIAITMLSGVRRPLGLGVALVGVPVGLVDPPVSHLVPRIAAVQPAKPVCAHGTHPISGLSIPQPDPRTPGPQAPKATGSAGTGRSLATRPMSRPRLTRHGCRCG